MVHGVLVVGPIISSSLTVARFVAAERALTILKNPESEKNLTRICTCGEAMAIDEMLAAESLTTEDEMLFADPLDDGFSELPEDDTEEVNGSSLFLDR
jgi:endoribonuclease Dicer